MNVEKSQEDKLSYLRYNAKYRKIVVQGRICDFIALNFRPHCQIKKISKNQYIKGRYEIRRTVDYLPAAEEIRAGAKIKAHTEKLFISEGEVFEVAEKKPDETGSTRNKRSLRGIFRELRYLINSNFNNAEKDKQLFITLTYEENMQDYKKLHADFRDFYKRLKRCLKSHELSYISIVEPQERGAWHVHLLLKTLNQAKLYIHHEDIEKLWGHGATRTERLNCDNIGSYFIAYLSNAELNDELKNALEINENDIKEKDGKKYIKGTRLKWYPDYMQIYRHSKNITYPKQVNGTDANVDFMENAFDKVTHQHVKEVGTSERTLVIAREQRTHKSRQG
jgi:hypothetical protein